MGLGGDFSLGIRMGALDAAQRQVEASSAEHHHFPGARRLPTGWKQSGNGSGTSSGTDPHRWEVLCAECGDTDGPAERQSAAVQELRGPYRHEHHARRVATQHFEES